ncbi:MAG: head decoration protein [Burkholderiaceae bacterium]|nr:head decoration protein [Burkholderiaceae bacterium]
MSANFQTEGTYTPDSLIAGNAHLLVGRKVTILSGQVLVRGAVLGKITDGGKYQLSASAATDGSETPDLILAEAADATAGDVSALAYERGDFNAGAVTLGTGHTAASIRDGLRAKGITLLTTIA